MPNRIKLALVISLIKFKIITILVTLLGFTDDLFIICNACSTAEIP